MLETLRLDLIGDRRRDDDGAVATLTRELPGLRVVVAATPSDDDDVAIDGVTWRGASWDPFAFDAIVVDALEHGSTTLRLDAADGATALSLVTRYQRYVRGPAAMAPVLATHRALHDLDEPLVRADFEHARDAWMWLLRLAPHASAALQIATLFHDVERLVSERDVRREHLASDYQAFKDAHARAGAALLRGALAGNSVDLATIDRAAWLVSEHERRGRDDELGLLNDADALSFFSLNSPGYAHYFGREQTARKVRYTALRMSEGARARLASIRLRADIEELVARAVPAEPQAVDARGVVLQ